MSLGPSESRWKDRGGQRGEVELSGWIHFPVSVSESKEKTDQPGEKYRRKSN